MHDKGHCFYGVPFSVSRSQERGQKHGRAGRIGILLWCRGRAIYLLPDSQGIVHQPRFQTDNWRRENSIWLDVGRMELSIRNGWLDEQKRVFIYFTLEEAMG